MYKNLNFVLFIELKSNRIFIRKTLEFRIKLNKFRKLVKENPATQKLEDEKIPENEVVWRMRYYHTKSV